MFFFYGKRQIKIKSMEFEALFNGIEDVRQDYIDGCNAYKINGPFLKKSARVSIFHFY